jgi:hypothetical protein
MSGKARKVGLAQQAHCGTSPRPGPRGSPRGPSHARTRRLRGLIDECGSTSASQDGSCSGGLLLHRRAANHRKHVRVNCVLWPGFPGSQAGRRGATNTDSGPRQSHPRNRRNRHGHIPGGTDRASSRPGPRRRPRTTSRTPRDAGGLSEGGGPSARTPGPGKITRNGPSSEVPSSLCAVNVTDSVAK